MFVQVPEPFQPFRSNEPVKIQVVVESNPKPTISWLLNGKELTAKDAQMVKDVATNTYSLTIMKLNSSIHNGTVTIRATNPVGTSIHEVNLVILDVPKITGKVENVTVNEGEEASFSCQFISNPLPESVQWLRDDREEVAVSETTLIETSETSTTMILKDTKLADNNTSFSVKPRNEMGEANSNKAKLMVSSGPAFI